jgi:hypothetical protein
MSCLILQQPHEGEPLRRREPPAVQQRGERAVVLPDDGLDALPRKSARAASPP